MSTRLQRYPAIFSLDGFTSAVPPPGPAPTLDGTYAISAPGTFYSVPTWVEGMDYYRFAFTLPVGSGGVGSLKLQGCIDTCRNSSQIPVAADLVNWTDIPFPAQAADVGTLGYEVLPQISWPVSDGCQIVLDEQRCQYLWVRMVLALSQGPIAPTVRWSLKGDGGR